MKLGKKDFQKNYLGTKQMKNSFPARKLFSRIFFNKPNTPLAPKNLKILGTDHDLLTEGEKEASISNHCCGCDY